MSGVSETSFGPAALLRLASADPRRSLELGCEMLEQFPSQDHVGRSTILRALGIAARLGATMVDSIGYGQQAIAEAELSGDRFLRSQALMSLAGSMAFSGDNERALQVLDRAKATTDSNLLAEIEFQQGSILARMGAMTEALACFQRSLPVFEKLDDRESIAMTLHNRAMVRIAAGDLAAAEGDLRRAQAIYAEDQSEADVAFADHGLGMVAALRGDVPLALEFFDRSEQTITELLGSASEIQVSRCEVLLSAGLFREALELSSEIVVDLTRAGLAEDEAEARLVGAQSAVLAGRPDLALSWANHASEMFTGQGRATWAALARLTAIQVRQDAEITDMSLLTETREVANILESEGHVAGAHRARLLAGMIGARLGAHAGVLADLRSVAERSSGSIEAQLQSRLARATMCVVEGDYRGALAAARAGMLLLVEYQAALGATDVRMGVERHGRDLGNLGLSLALESRIARRVFSWMELRRGRAIIHRPVTPPDDDDLADDLTALRQVNADLRTADGGAILGLRSRQRKLQESVRNRARLTRGTRGETDRVDVATISDSLSERTLVEMAVLEGIMWAVVVRNGRFRLCELGPEAEVTAELASLRFMMRRLARGRGSTAMAERVANRLDDLLFGSLHLGDGPLVIVPTPALHATPWWALPTCQDRQMTISPSAELWYRARHGNPGMDHVLVVAGPDLQLSDDEVTEVGALYGGATLLTSEESSVESVHSSLNGARMAHIASHAYFQFENPMFSSLRLADGDLNVYDIERLNNAPEVVVLSACDSGFTETHPGEELMGLSSALLSMGTKTVIASVGLVPDSAATKELMVALHRGLIAGLSPSVALHKAQTEMGDTPEGYIAASSFICIGAG